MAVPAGDCSWGSLTISKGIHLRGAGAGATNITLSGAITLRKHATRSVEVSGFTFRRSGGGNSAKMMYVEGPWNGEPPLIHDNVFIASNSGIIRYQTNGGVIYRNTFRGDLDDSALQHKVDGDSESWSTPDTMGTRDTNGKRNLYVEDNVFEGMANQATDFDDAARVVFRHNTLVSSSFNSHGLDTSPIGVRHYEIYENSFRYPNKSVNQSWHIWLRGGTGVIFNNQVEDLNGTQWGNKTELLFSVRAAVDGGVEGCCRSYPCKHQVGQNHDGSSQFTDPVRLWNNSGTLAWGLNSAWNNTCGQNMEDYLQNGRDFIFATSPKSGYTPYPYPHPLRVDTARPLPPSGLTVAP
ncbi:MAG TPA: hypothetical protein VNL92_07505 [Dehalococcoidia bacterium]|nr:hypothetical protein [Dehalococcoidia bacterium]